MGVGEFYSSHADIFDAAILQEKTSIPHSNINYRMLLNKDGLVYLCGKRLTARDRYVFFVFFFHIKKGRPARLHYNTHLCC